MATELSALKNKLLKKGFKLSTKECHEWVAPDGTGFLIADKTGYGGDHHELAVATGLVKQGASSDPLLKLGWIRYNIKKGCELWDIDKSSEIIDDRLMKEPNMFGVGNGNKFFFIDERKNDEHYKIFYNDWKDCDFSIKKVIAERKPTLS